MPNLKWLQRRRARADVVLAAKCVASSYQGPDTGLIYDHDPDDLHDLRKAVAALRALEGAPEGVIHVGLGRGRPR